MAQRSSGTPRASTHALTPWPAWLRVAGRTLGGGEPGRERDRGQHAERDGHDRAPRAMAVAGRGRDRDRVPPLLDAAHRRAEHDLAAHVGGDRLVERRRAAREAPAEHGGLQVAPEQVVGGGYPAQEVEHRRVLRRRRGARGDPEQHQVAHPRREAERADPVARRHVEVLQPLRVGRRGRRRGGGRRRAARRSPARARRGRRGRPAACARRAPRRSASGPGSAAASCSRATP